MKQGKAKTEHHSVDRFLTPVFKNWKVDKCKHHVFLSVYHHNIQIPATSTFTILYLFYSALREHTRSTPRGIMHVHPYAVDYAGVVNITGHPSFFSSRYIHKGPVYRIQQIRNTSTEDSIWIYSRLCQRIF